MKHFLFTIASRTRAGFTRGQVKLHRIVNGVPKFLGTYNYTFESEAQAVYNAIAELKALPEKVLADCMHATGGRDHTKLAKIVTIHNLSHTEIRS